MIFLERFISFLCQEYMHWSNHLDFLLLCLCRDACYTTQPLELLNPESMLTFGSDFVQGPRKLSVNTSPLREAQTPTRQSEAHAEHPEIHDNGTVEGTPRSISNGDTSKNNRRLSFDSLADDRLERLSIAESEGTMFTPFKSAFVLF